MWEFDRPYDIDEIRGVCEEFVEWGIARRWTVSGVTRY
jgi:hypothetical protein